MDGQLFDGSIGISEIGEPPIKPLKLTFIQPLPSTKLESALEVWPAAVNVEPSRVISVIAEVLGKL